MFIFNVSNSGIDLLPGGIVFDLEYANDLVLVDYEGADKTPSRKTRSEVVEHVGHLTHIREVVSVPMD